MLGGVGRPQCKSRLHVPAEQVARIGLDAGDNRGGERADAGDRGHPEHEAGQKDAQAADPATHLAVGEAEGINHRYCAQSARHAAPARNGAIRRSSTIVPSST